MITLPRVAARIFGEPLAIDRGKLDVILTAIGPRLQGQPLPGDEDARAQRDALNVDADGIATIDISGTLVCKASGMDALSGLTSYADVAAEYSAALSDARVRGILLTLDSPGGEVLGMLELADLMYSARGRKPVCAAVDCAASAAYLLASCADRIVVSRTGITGSVGIIALHLDESAADAQAGLKYTAVYAGDRKNDGNPHEPLTPEARGGMQDRVDKVYEMFVDAVARNRGMGQQAVRDTQAAIYMGQDGVDKGLADEVGCFEDARCALLGCLGNAAAFAAKRRGVLVMPAIAVHHTATSKAAWDAGEAEKRLKAGEGAAYYRKEYAWQESGKEGTAKAHYKFPHHEVSADGDVEAANLKACQSIVAILNGGMGGADIPDADREGVYAHAAAHLRDAGEDAAPLKGSAAGAASPPKEGKMDVPEKAAPTAAEIDALVAQARTEGLAAAGEIADLCAIAGTPARIAEFLGAKKTVAQVRADLLKARADAEAGTQLQTAVLPGAKAPNGETPQGTAKPWKEVLKGLGFLKKEGN